MIALADISRFDLNRPLVLGVSGGLDSIALLHLLKESGFEQLLVAHVDHQLRERSSADADFVRGLAEELGLRFFDKKVNVAELAEQAGGNVEAIGRRERYRFFDELLTEHEAQAVVTAHHADDQLETVLMNMLRGCGLDGLKGMKTWDEKRWRPLLLVTKDELESYCRDRDLAFVQDESNEDLSYRRNYLRHRVIPLLKELNPNLLETFSDNVAVWSVAASYLETRAQAYLNEQELSPGRFELRAFQDLELVEQQAVLRELYERVHGSKRDFMQAHLEQVLKVLRQNVSGKQKEFGPGKHLRREREWFEVLDA